MYTALLHELPGNGPPKRLTVGVKMAFEDVSIRCFKRSNSEVLRVETAAWVAPVVHKTVLNGSKDWLRDIAHKAMLGLG